MHELPVFAYYSMFTMRTTRQDLLFRVAILECFVSKLIAFLLFAVIGVPSRLRNAFSRVFNCVSEGGLFAIPFRLREFVVDIAFFKIIRQCSFDASLAFLAYRRSVEVD